MNIRFFLLSLVFFTTSLSIEGAITTLPSAMMFLVLYSIIRRDEWSFIFAFIGGISLDRMLLRPLGLTALYFLSTVLLLFLYQRKLEIASTPFVVGSLFLFSSLYLFLFIRQQIFEQAIINTLIGTAIFWLYSLSQYRKDKLRHSHQL